MFPNTTSLYPATVTYSDKLDPYDDAKEAAILVQFDDGGAYLPCLTRPLKNLALN